MGMIIFYTKQALKEMCVYMFIIFIIIRHALKWFRSGRDEYQLE